MSYPPFLVSRQHKHVDITTGDYTLAASQTTSALVPSGPSIVMSNVQQGDVLLATLSAVGQTGGSGEIAFDAATVISSAIESQFSLGTRPVGLGYSALSSNAAALSGTSSHTVLADDIATGGIVTVQITYINSGAATATLYANSTYSLRFGVINIGPQDLT